MTLEPWTFEFTTDAAPVQAQGTIAGRPFYFRARHSEWSFAVAERPGVDPVDLDAAGAARGDGWLWEGIIKSSQYEASYLSRERAEAIIRECAAAYLADQD